MHKFWRRHGKSKNLGCLAFRLKGNLKVSKMPLFKLLTEHNLRAILDIGFERGFYLFLETIRESIHL
jgi:hypothetical protein